MGGGTSTPDTPDLIQVVHFRSPRLDDRLSVDADADGALTITLERLVASRPEEWRPFTQFVIQPGLRVTIGEPQGASYSDMEGHGEIPAVQVERIDT